MKLIQALAAALAGASQETKSLSLELQNHRSNLDHFPSLYPSAGPNPYFPSTGTRKAMRQAKKNRKIKARLPK